MELALVILFIYG